MPEDVGQVVLALPLTDVERPSSVTNIVLMGMGDVSQGVVPKISLLSKPANGGITNKG